MDDPMQDALDLLSDDQLRGALTRRREHLLGVLADTVTDRLMPDFDSYDAETRGTIEKRLIVVQGAIKSIDARLSKAQEALRSIKLATDEPAAE